MVSGLCSCFSFVSRAYSWFCLMGVLLICSMILLVGHFLLPSAASLRSWFCDTCTSCQVCPPCAPQVNVSPHCEWRENLNNCNCRCLTEQHLQEYSLHWSSHLGVQYNNTVITQNNSHVVKHRLLFWLIGLSFFNLFLLFLLGLLVFFSPTLLRRWTRWYSTSRLQRRQRIMKKFNLVEYNLSHVTLPPADLFSSNTLDHHAQLMVTLTNALQSAHVQSSSPTTTTISRIT